MPTEADARAPLAGRLRAAFATGATRPLSWRREQVSGLARMLAKEAPQLTSAMGKDMGKPPVEAWLTDIAAVRRDVDAIVRHLDSWAAPRRVKVPWPLRPGRAQVVPEPLGAVLVIGPWNYPVRCAVLPLAFAIAAGNTAALKPSELAPATAEVLAGLLPTYLSPSTTVVALGGPEVARELLEQRWDHVFFTGGARAGRQVMAAAARHLTPVTLELGGKNPAIVDHTAEVDIAARRIAWGRFLNAGQTCVAPDYVLVDKRVEEQLVAALAKWARRFFGDDPRASSALARIVNDAHFQRLSELLTKTGGQLVTGGSADAMQRYVAPTVLRDVSWDDPVMEEEIFGPILPVLPFASIDEVVARVNERDKPLALYLYSRDANAVERVIAETSSGGVCVNHNTVQLGVPGLPFGGVGASGMGAYHGQASFDTFSHAKAVLQRPMRGELPLVYPPYGRLKRWALRRAL